jgi:hypothetical protein
VADHILGDSDIVVDFAVVDLENQADKVGQDGGTACLCLDRRSTLAGLGSNDGQSVYPRCQNRFQGYWAPVHVSRKFATEDRQKLIWGMLTGQCVGLGE